MLSRWHALCRLIFGMSRMRACAVSASACVDYRNPCEFVSHAVVSASQVQQWCSVDPASLPGNPGPPWTLQLQATPHDQARACWARCPQPRGASIRAGKSSLMMEHRASKDPSGCRAESVLMDEITTPAMACRAELRRSSGSLCSRRYVMQCTQTLL